MATEIKTWEIVNGELKAIDSSLIEQGRKEKEHLEKWIKTNPRILGTDILVIGEQVQTKSGPLDFLGIDNEGNLVIVELKRDKVPREALTQAIDYASDIANWSTEKISEVCFRFSGKSIDEQYSEYFESNDDFIINNSQRLLLVGFGVEESLNRMIEWLSQNFDVSINAIILNYVITSSGNELLSRTVIIPEEVEKERSSKRKRTKSIVKTLFETNKLREGDILIYHPAVEKGFDISDKRIKATIVNINSTKSCLKREDDSELYSFSKLRWVIIEEL